MIICERCGWVVRTDCTCRQHEDELAAVRIRGLLLDRHRESVARAEASAWPIWRTPDAGRATG